MTLLLGALTVTGCAVGSNPSGSSSASHAETCEPINVSTVAGLFDRWNASLQTGEPAAVVKNYAEPSILLPTLSGVNRVTQDEKEAYFTHFLASKPIGRVIARQVDIGCNMATDSGLYTFSVGNAGQEIEARYTFTYRWTGQEWLISSHHSSILPSK